MMRIVHGDCLSVLRSETPGTVDMVCTDPPYGLNFMSRHWDHGVPGSEYWREILRVAKPGAYLTAFGGTRTYHRLTCAIEDAGWEIRDSLMWLYGTGFPKSLDVGKKVPSHNGYGTALKPSYEPIILARKPLVGTVAQNVQKHGTGGLNIDATRIATTDRLQGGAYAAKPTDRHDGTKNWRYKRGQAGEYVQPSGRWPPNVLLGHAADCTDESCDPECPCRMLDEQAPRSGGNDGRGNCKGKRPGGFGNVGADKGGVELCATVYPDTGGASRFFPRFYYSAKASRKERGEGNDHPTVKPVAVIQWLLTLISPPQGGIVLDPFMGSGSTALAARALGLSFMGVEMEQAYCEIARRRLRPQARKGNK